MACGRSRRHAGQSELADHDFGPRQQNRGGQMGTAVTLEKRQVFSSPFGGGTLGIALDAKRIEHSNASGPDAGPS